MHRGSVLSCLTRAPDRHSRRSARFVRAVAFRNVTTQRPPRRDDDTETFIRHWLQPAVGYGSGYAFSRIDDVGFRRPIRPSRANPPEPPSTRATRDAMYSKSVS